MTETSQDTILDDILETISGTPPISRGEQDILNKELLEKLGESYKICVECNEPFIPNSKQHYKFCTRQCKTNYQHRKWYADNKDKAKEFARQQRLKNGYNKEYHNRKSRENYAKNKSRYRYNNLKRKYGVTKEEYHLILANQNHRCAICMTEETGGNKFRLDHDHSTNKVREILCNNCNLGIGNLKENIAIMKRAIEYIEKHSK